jgi:DNA replication protein DnaC
MKKPLSQWRPLCPRCSRKRCRKVDGEYIICRSCEKKQLERRDVQLKEYRKQNANELLEKAGVPIKFREASIRKVSFLSSNEGSCMMIGKKGIGKTYAMCALARAFMLKGRDIQFITAPELLLEIRRAFNNKEENINEYDIIQRYRNVDYLFLDDLGVEKASEWVLQTLYLIIDGRYSQGKFMCVSSNLSLGELANRLDDRIVTRLVEQCKVLKLKGKNRRLPNG